MLDVQRLTVSCGDAVAVNQVSLHVDDGELVALLGTNGAGKSTTLKAVVGLLRPAAGRIQLDGADIAGLTPPQIVNLGVSMVPEGRQMFAHLSVLDNLQLGGYSRRKEGPAYLRQRVEAVCELFPALQSRLRQAAGSLSGGQQQMVAIGRALMPDPRLLIMDEPSLGLAPQACADIFRAIDALHRDGMSILLVEQNARLSLEVAQRAYVLDKGAVVLSGPAAELASDASVQEHYLALRLTAGPPGSQRSDGPSERVRRLRELLSARGPAT